MIHTVEGAERIRTFDIRETPEGAAVEVRSILATELAAGPVDDPLGSLRREGPELALTRAQFSALVQALRAAGIGGRIAARGPSLSPRGTGSHWLANGCDAGGWFVTLVSAELRFEEAGLSVR
jgi:hypothetical protein